MATCCPEFDALSQAMKEAHRALYVCTHHGAGCVHAQADFKCMLIECDCCGCVHPIRYICIDTKDPRHRPMCKGCADKMPGRRVMARDVERCTDICYVYTNSLTRCGKMIV